MLIERHQMAPLGVIRLLKAQSIGVELVEQRLNALLQVQQGRVQQGDVRQRRIGPGRAWRWRLRQCRRSRTTQAAAREANGWRADPRGSGAIRRWRLLVVRGG